MKDAIQKTIIGLAGPSAGYAVSLTTAEAWLRVLSLVVGIAVGIASFISIGFSIRRKYLSWRMEQKHNSKHKEEEPTTTI
jgi:ABC-type nickel/cobalt efflux system permease component RcnA